MRYEVTAPDGRRFEIEAPEGTAPDVLTREVEAAFRSMPSQPAQPRAADGVPGPRQAPTGRGEGMLPFANRLIAETFGAPVDVANAALRAVGLPVSERPFGGSASIESGLARFGRAVDAPMVPSEGAVAETPEEYIGQGIGQAAGMLIPGLGVARLAATSARPLVARVGESVARAPVVAPVTTMGVETAAGAGAGYGRYVAEQNFPDVEGAGALGELAGGLGVGALTTVPSLLARTPGVPTVAAAITPFTKTGSRTRAADRLSSLAEDPAAASRAADAPTISELTPAQRTGEPRLLALEKAVAAENPAIARDLRERATRAQQTLEEEARALGGDPMQTRAFLESRVTRLSEALNTRVEQAQTRARERIAALEPNAPADAASRIAREEFDNAYAAARAQESVLWNSIPGDVRIDTAPLFQRFAALVDATPVTGREDIPAYARRFLGRPGPDEGEDEATALIRQLQPDLLPARPQSARLGETATPAELQTMRSKLLEIERVAYKEGRRNEGRIAGQIADDVLASLDSLPETTGPYAVARAYSRNMNEMFRGGAVAPLSRMGDAAEARTPPELTLERLLGPGGAPADIAARDLLAATGDSPATRQAVEDYLARSFRNTAMSADGAINRPSATNWMRKNEALLERFPEVRNRLAEAMTAQSQAATAGARQTAVERGLRQRDDSRMARLLDQRQQSAVATFLNANPGREVTRVFGADNPAEIAAGLRRSVDRDPSGQALSGLRGAFIDNLLGRARQTTPDGPVFNGSAIMDALNDPKQVAALGAVFDAPAMQRLRQIGTEFTALERTRGDLPGVGRSLEDAPAQLLNFVATIAAARFGAKLGADTGLAGGLQAAQKSSATATKLVRFLTADRARKLIADAVTDPGLFATLLSPTRTAKEQEVAVRRLQGWLAGTAGREIAGEEEDRQPAPNAMAPAGASGNVNAMSR